MRPELNHLSIGTSKAFLLKGVLKSKRLRTRSAPVAPFAPA